MSFQWRTRPSQVWPTAAQAHTQAIRRAVLALARRYAVEIEAYMKANAPWQDRTGNLRQALFTEVNEVGLDMVEIILSHGLNYGIFLELKFGGRDSILAPTIDVFGPRLFQDLVALLRD